MAKEILPPGLWERIEPVLAEMDPRRGTGRPRIPDRAVLTGILFVLKTGVPWEHLPLEMGCGSGMTCWRRLQRWIELGVWERIHQLLLDELQESGKLDWTRASLDASSIPAKRGARKQGRIRPIGDVLGANII